MMCFNQSIQSILQLSQIYKNLQDKVQAGQVFLDHPRKRLIKNQSIDDNKCFKWSIVRSLNTANHHPARNKKADKDFAKILDFKGINFPARIRNIHKTEKQNSISISIFGNENHPIYV